MKSKACLSVGLKLLALLILFSISCGNESKKTPSMSESKNETERASPFQIAVGDKVCAKVPEDFLAINYSGQAKYWDNSLKRTVLSSSPYASPLALSYLAPLGLRIVRVWATVPKFHPAPQKWDWSNVENPVDEVLKAGFKVLLCLDQRTKWFVGDEQKPWWESEEGMEEWVVAARALAEHFKGKVGMIEILNEPEHIHKDKPDYMGWDKSIELFVAAARAIKEVDSSILCGGPAGWNRWEPAEWGRRVLKNPDNERFLDFISYHIYQTHKYDEPDEAIMENTFWFEESPLYIKRMMAGASKKPMPLLLTEFNVNGMWQKDGKLWHDKRQTSAFGGVWLASALLHSAKGGCDIAARHTTIGGFGIITWPPLWEPNSAYFAWRMLREVGGLEGGAEILECSTTEGGRKAQLRDGTVLEFQVFHLEPFAIRRKDKGISVVLVNKTNQELRAVVKTPKGMGDAEVCLYSLQRTSDCLLPTAEVKAQGGEEKRMDTPCPPMSITIVKFDSVRPF